MEPSSSSSPKLVADNPFEIPELYDIILQNTAINDLAALRSTSRQMVRDTDQVISTYNRPLVKKILKSEENTKKGNEHIAHNDKVQYVEYLLWYWKLLDHRFLSLSTLWFEWGRPRPIDQYTMVDKRWHGKSTLAVLSTMAGECYKSLRKTGFGEEIRELMAPITLDSRQPTTRDYETLGLAGAVAFQRSPPDYYLDESLDLVIIMLYLKRDALGFSAEISEMSSGFDALVRSRLACMGCLMYWTHHKRPQVTYYGKSSRTFWQALELLKEGFSDDDEWRNVHSICETYAERVHKMNRMAISNILTWRFGDEAAQKLQDQPYGDKTLLEVAEPLQFRLNQLNWDFLEARDVFSYIIFPS